MTHTKFTELLNLYLDHEISMEEAAALETEIQRNPEYREIYRQYCRMHKGCTQLAAKFVSPVAPAAPSRELADRRKAVRSRFATWTAGLGVAAAACFTVVLINREPAQEPTAQPAVAQVAQKSPASNQIAVAPAVFSLPALNTRSSEMHSVFSPTLLRPDSSEQPARALYVNAQGDRFEWMDRVETVNADEDYGFQVRPKIPEGQRTFRSQRPIEGRVEMTAYQFQR